MIFKAVRYLRCAILLAFVATSTAAISMSSWAQPAGQISPEANMLNNRGLSKQEIVVRMSLDIERGVQGYLQLDPQINQYAIRILQASYITDVQQKAAQPFLEAMCAEMESSSPDVIRAATSLDRAIAAESTVYDDIYDAVMLELPDEKYLNLENLLANTSGYTSDRINWEAEAKSNPEEVAFKLARACERYRNARHSENSQPASLRLSLDK